LRRGKEKEMADRKRAATAIGEVVQSRGKAGARVGDREVILGQPPLVLQAQPYGYVQLESPEELKQWEEDLRNFYGITLDASSMAGRAGESCSAGCTDDCCML
jgi:hypothetical protein